MKFVFSLMITVFCYYCSGLWNLKSTYYAEVVSQRADFNFGDYNILLFKFIMKASSYNDWIKFPKVPYFFRIFGFLIVREFITEFNVFLWSFDDSFHEIIHKYIFYHTYSAHWHYLILCLLWHSFEYLSAMPLHFSIHNRTGFLCWHLLSL